MSKKNSIDKMNSRERMERFLEGKTSPEETLRIIEEAAFDPEMQEAIVTNKRLNYVKEVLEEYGQFVPSGDNIADDGQGLCDLRCEAFILRQEGVVVEESLLAEESKNNYWLRDGGTPLHKMGKLLERKGFLVNRFTGASIDKLQEDLKSYKVIVVVNGDTLSGVVPDIFDENFSLDNNPNHAIVVLSVDKPNGKVTVFNPSLDQESAEYPLEAFEKAWEESKNYELTVRRKSFPEEYNPQPVDVSRVSLDEDLMELTEVIAENAHDEWGLLKKAAYKDILENDPGYRIYAPLVDGKEQAGHNHFWVPYSMLTEEEKDIDRITAINTIKLVKRLGYRLVNVNKMFKCPHCGKPIEPSYNFCPACGEEIPWETFK